MTTLTSDPKIFKAAAELEQWTTDTNPQLSRCIAHINRQHLGLHYAKNKDHGEFINHGLG